MDEFPDLLARDFGLRPQGKSAPMASSKASSAAASPWNRSGSGRAAAPVGDPNLGGGGGGGGDVFDSIFDAAPREARSRSSSSLPVFDKPVYDDDIFDGVPGVRSSSVRYDDVLASMASGSNRAASASPPYDDLLENLGKAMPDSSDRKDRRSEERKEEGLPGFDDLIPGFGGSSPPQKKREATESNQQKSATSAKPTGSMPDDPFVVLETASTSAYSSPGLFSNPLENIGKSMNSESTKIDSSPIGGIFGDSNAFDELSKSVPIFSAEVNNKKDESPLNMETFTNDNPKVQSAKSSNFNKPVSSNGFQTSERDDRNGTFEDQSPKSNENNETSDDVWLTVSEIPLFTKPTSAPPPLRPPPPLVIKQMHNNHSKESVEKSGVSPIDELEDFAMGKAQAFANDSRETFIDIDEIDKNSTAAASAAAMKEAMDRAEAKFKHAKEVRERERRESARVHDLEDKDKQERLEHEQEQKEREEEQKRLERNRELELEREREKARQAVEKATREARERAAAEARQKAEREARLRAERMAVQRAQAEARERAATDAKVRAERAAAEARERAAVEARERAAAEARERVNAEARERTASDARAKAERTAVERATAEARQRAERAAVERAAAEARERLAAAAREKQQQQQQQQQQQYKAENDLESFFSMGSRANSAPKQRAPPSETVFDAQTQGRGNSDGPRWASSGSASTMRKASSATNIVDDLSSIFGGPSSSGEFQEIEGESEERRRARLERHQRTLERAAKALAEKNERDMQTQREQAERHRIGETMDFEIKRWAAGKEGNLRALLSTLQYILWPECGWQPVSLTDLITAAAVKKVYRKATLCIHPDKVQQKGANLQQKYIAEKVFDLLKEAWNKFNSEELF
ncbi:Auxilin-related protein 1 [Ananas comosus]|uniref:Auxilin-related protein 1 n=2 Tax=Ananas comosus TaxID=4615 RepID=A0A199W0R0_ANACO|nr:Auxilin-related protein 1 [Ananas comosus]